VYHCQEMSLPAQAHTSSANSYGGTGCDAISTRGSVLEQQAVTIGRGFAWWHEVRFGGGQAIQPSLLLFLHFEIQGIAMAV
jgi:hypothetical protein